MISCNNRELLTHSIPTCPLPEEKHSSVFVSATPGTVTGIGRSLISPTFREFTGLKQDLLEVVFVLEGEKRKNVSVLKKKKRKKRKENGLVSVSKGCCSIQIIWEEIGIC